VLRFLGREHLGRWEVTACEPGVWRRVAGTLPFGVPFQGEDRFEDIADGTRVTLDLSWNTPLGQLGRAVEVLASPLLRRQLRSNALRAAALL
jgi:hypothetical protein